jgi:L-rhamnose isomerase
MGNNIERSYGIAKEKYASYGVDTDSVLEKMKNIPFAVHGWQADDFSGFERPEAELAGGGLLSTGNFPGAARNLQEYRQDIEKVFTLVPGKKRFNFHTINGDFGGKYYDRDKILPEHFTSWVEWAKKNDVGLDMNSTFISHKLAEDGYTLSHTDKKIRDFWIEHGKKTRAIGNYLGSELNNTCIHNVWIPDGSKDIPVSKYEHRKILEEALDEMFSEPYPESNVRDSLESKLFGVALESFTVGSHEFYLAYCVKNNILITFDTGHFHAEEFVSDKISAVVNFVPGIVFHLSRGVRWDSDHITLFSDEMMAIMQEVVRAGALDKTFIGTEFFDASVNRIGAYATGLRAAQKSLLFALLEPHDVLSGYEKKNQLFARLGMLENLKSMPHGDVWNYYCQKENVPADDVWIDEVLKYEKDVILKRK